MAGSFVQFAEKLMQDAQAAVNRDKIAQSIQANPQPDAIHREPRGAAPQSRGCAIGAAGRNNDPHDDVF